MDVYRTDAASIIIHSIRLTMMLPLCQKCLMIVASVLVYMISNENASSHPINLSLSLANVPIDTESFARLFNDFIGNIQFSEKIVKRKFRVHFGKKPYITFIFEHVARSSQNSFCDFFYPFVERKFQTTLCESCDQKKCQKWTQYLLNNILELSVVGHIVQIFISFDIFFQKESSRTTPIF